MNRKCNSRYPTKNFSFLYIFYVLKLNSDDEESYYTIFTFKFKKIMCNLEFKYETKVFHKVIKLPIFYY